jgi:hypothetical protein
VIPVVRRLLRRVVAIRLMQFEALDGVRAGRRDLRGVMIVKFQPRRSWFSQVPPMRLNRWLPFVLIFLVLPAGSRAQDESKTLMAGIADPDAVEQQTNAPNAAPGKIVYVSDFELDSVAVRDDKNAQANGASTATPGSQDNATKKEEGPAEQARRMVDLLSVTVVKELVRAGYTAERLRDGQAVPAQGVAIRGIFAEPDAQNRLRRAVIGQGAIGAKMELFVGVSNLARRPQKLYEPADSTNSDSSKVGALITVSSYAPVAKFDVEKNTTEKSIRDTASAIVTDLTALLNANLAALDQ